jgi:hypothetical protein
LNGEEIAKILCLMGYGMKLTVPDEWLDRYMPGPRTKQQARIQELALDYQCALHQSMGSQTFEKLRAPYTG